jgi:uncharacterized protein (DUF58 family)
MAAGGPGMGDEFWQYRPARPGDEARMIDWRRSAMSDAHFVREKEWQAAQSVHIWVDEAQSMDFASEASLATKSERAKLLALAMAVLLIRGGERVALANLGTPPRSSQLQLLRIAEAFTRETERPDYGAPEVRGMLPHARALFISDFLAPLDAVTAQLGKAADRGVRGVLFQILDPQEEAFPFDGRTIFESMGRSLSHETLKAGDLRDRYLERLAERKDQLETLARRTGWLYHATTRLTALRRRCSGFMPRWSGGADVHDRRHRVHRAHAASGSGRAAGALAAAARGAARADPPALSGRGAAAGPHR